MKIIRSFLRRLLFLAVLSTYPVAVVKLSALFTSMRGRYAGGVFRNWKGLTVLGALPSAVANPSTQLQEKARNILSTASKLWSGFTLTTKSEWREVAVFLTATWKNFQNPVGERSLIYPPRGPFTGLGALTSVAGLLGSVDHWAPGDATPAAPVSVTNPTLPVLGAISGDTTAGLTILFRDPSEWGINGTAGFVRIFIKSEQGSFHTQLSGVLAAGVETLTVTQLRPRGGGAAVPIREGYYFIQADAVNAEGLRGAPSAIGEFLLPAGI